MEPVQTTPIMPEPRDADLRAISTDSCPIIKGSPRPSAALKVFLGASRATQGYRDGWRWFGALECLWIDLSSTILCRIHFTRLCQNRESATPGLPRILRDWGHSRGIHLKTALSGTFAMAGEEESLLTAHNSSTSRFWHGKVGF